MAIPSGFTAIATGIVEGNEQNYTVTIAQRDTITPLLEHRAITLQQELVWKFGSLIGGTIEKGLMPGFTDTKLLDPASVLFYHFSNSRTNGADDLDYYIDITSDNFELGGYVRLKSLDTLEAYWVQVPALALQSFDGMGVLNDVRGSTSNFTLGGLILGASLLNTTQDIRTDFGVSNATGTDTILDVTSITADEDYERDRQLQKQVELAYEILMVRIWNGFDGIFHGEQPHLMGQAGQVYRNLGVTPVSVEETVYQLSEGDFEDGLRRRLRDPIVGVEIERTWKDRQVTVGGVEVPLICSMLRGGGFNNIHNKALEHWVPVGSGGGGTLDARGRNDTCLLLAEDEANEQTGAWISAGEDIPLMLHGWFALESTGAGGASKSAYIQVEWDPWNSVLDQTLYLNASGNWQSGNTTLQTPTQTTQANGAGTLTWHEWWIMISEKAPSTGRVIVRLLGAGEAGDAGYNTGWDDLMLSPASPESDDGTGKPARVQSITLATELYAYDGSTGLPLVGEKVKMKHDVPHCSYIFESNSGTLGSFLFEFLEFNLFDGAETPNRFQVQYFTYDGNNYVDPVEMIYQYIRDLAGEYVWELVGSLNALAPPEKPLRDLQGVDFFMVRGSSDLAMGTTEGIWIQNILPPTP